MILSALWFRLERQFHPKTLPAPCGRGPGGWPLVACLTCQGAIPWMRWDGGLVTPRIYYEKARHFCHRDCAREYLGPMPPPERKSPVDFNALPEEPPVVFERRLPRFEEIRECPKCGNRVLQEWEVSKSCLLCGQTMFAADSDWHREEHVAIVAGRKRL